ITYTAPSTSDAVDGTGVASCAPASGTSFAIGTTAVSCSATDAHGNAATPTTFSVVVRDTTPPAVTVPANITAEGTGSAGAAVTFAASATDIVDGAVAVTCNRASGSTFAIATTTVVCSATDVHLNTGSASFSVTVRDTTPPAVTVPANITAEATSSAGAAVPFSASATDIVDGPLTPSCSRASGSTFALGTTTVNCSATDAHANTGSASFTVTVRDTTPPTISVPADNLIAEAT